MVNKTRVPARRRRLVLVASLGVLAAAASVGLALPAAAGDRVCVRQPAGPGCVTGTRHFDGTAFVGYVADSINDNFTIELTVGYMEIGPGAQPWQWTETVTAHRPENGRTNINLFLSGVQAEWMVLELCREDMQTGERECDLSQVVAV
jgi:hypothetical protein